MFYLDKYKLSDAQQHYVILQQKVQGYWCGFKPPLTLAEATDYIKMIIDADTYAIRNSENDILVGNVSLKLVENQPDVREFGYWLDMNYANRGIMSNMIVQLIDKLDGTKVKTLEIHFYDGNIESQKVAQKCGFKYVKSVDNYYLERLDEYRIKHIYQRKINC